MNKLRKLVIYLLNGTLLKVFKRKCFFRKYNKKEISDKEYLIKLGKISLGYKMNLDNPQTFNEKINWYKLNYLSNLMVDAVDKIKVKEYVKSKKLETIIIPTIKTYLNVNDINLDDLPNQFVVKNTMDSGGVFVCNDKSKISLNDIKNKLNSNSINEFVNGKHWLREYAYVPNTNRIIIEQLLETNDGHAPFDYKFFCFNGEPRFLFVGSERDVEVKFDFYDIDFNWINVKQGHKNSFNRPIKPKNYEEMLKICRILSKDFPQVRVDLYNLDGKIFFGELTFYHFGGITPFKPKKWDKIFGSFWDLNFIDSYRLE